MSVDVECAATGRGHNDRAPCRIGLVNEREEVLFDTIVRVPNCFSPLTQITGLTREMIAQGIEIERALYELRKFLGPDVILVGQKIDKDINWLSLQKGIDFDRYIDISNSFRVWNARYRNWNYFSLRHEAFGLLGIRMNRSHHDPTEDAKISMRLFRQFIKPGRSTAQDAAQQLMLMRYHHQFPSFLSQERTHLIDGVCSAAFRPSECICGQPFYN